MKKIFFLILCILCMQMNAQELMRITTNDGTTYDLSINNVSNMQFVTPEPIDVVGEWLTADKNTMYCYQYNADGSFLYKNLSMYQPLEFEYSGTYTLEDNILKIKFDGNTSVIEIMSCDAIKLVSQVGDVYYRVQSPAYEIDTNSEPIHIGGENDIIQYAAGSIVKTEDNKVKPISDGVGYVLAGNEDGTSIRAYKVEVSFVYPPMVDWKQYFKKSKDDLETIFGTGSFDEAKHRLSYSNFDSSIQYVVFSLSDDNSQVTGVSVMFYDGNKRKQYCDDIETNYVLNRETSTGKIYYDTNDKNTATVQITVYNASEMCTIVYTDLKPTPPPAVDWTKYLGNSSDQITAVFGIDPSADEEDLFYMYTNVNNIKRVTFYFTEGFGKVERVRVAFNDANSMQNYLDVIAAKYVLNSETDTRKTYYDTDSQSTASIGIIIDLSRFYITYEALRE